MAQLPPRDCGKGGALSHSLILFSLDLSWPVVPRKDREMVIKTSGYPLNLGVSQR